MYQSLNSLKIPPRVKGMDVEGESQLLRTMKKLYRELKRSMKR